MKQYIIDFQDYSVKSDIIKMMQENNLNTSEIEDVSELQKSFFGSYNTVTIDKQKDWKPQRWLKYLISKGFWIDSYTSSESRTQSGYYQTNIAIVHFTLT